MQLKVRETVLYRAKHYVILSNDEGALNQIRENMRNKTQELTKAELEIMQVIWQKEKVLVHDVLAELPEPKPAYNTVSTIVRILEKKGFVSHKAYGRTYEYFPIVGKEEYTNIYMHTVLDNFFDGSLSRMVNFFSAQKSISLEETDEILKILNGDK